MGKFTLPIGRDEAGAVKSADLANGIGDGLLSRLVRAQLNKKPHRVNGKLIYQVQVDNASPLILNGIAILGSTSSPTEAPERRLGHLCLAAAGAPCSRPPRNSSIDSVLKKGVRVTAVDLSGL